MDADSCLHLPFVVGLDLRPDGSYGIRYQVNPDGPYPSPYPADKGPMVAVLVDAVGVAAADWPSATADTIAAMIGSQWIAHCPNLPPPPNQWSDVNSYGGSAILSSQGADWTKEQWPAGTPVAEIGDTGALRSGSTIVEVLDGSHALLSQPAYQDAQGLTVAFGE